MKLVIVLMLIFGMNSIVNAKDGYPDYEYEDMQEVSESEVIESNREVVLPKDQSIRITVVGQGIAPEFVTSAAQAYVMAKRAAMVEAYRMIAERVNGVKVEGQDTIKNMAVKRSTVKAKVKAMIRNAVLVESNFKDGICEVELELILDYKQFKR